MDKGGMKGKSSPFRPFIFMEDGWSDPLTWPLHWLGDHHHHLRNWYIIRQCKGEVDREERFKSWSKMITLCFTLCWGHSPLLTYFQVCRCLIRLMTDKPESAKTPNRSVVHQEGRVWGQGSNPLSKPTTDPAAATRGLGFTLIPSGSIRFQTDRDPSIYDPDYLWWGKRVDPT